MTMSELLRASSILFLLTLGLPFPTVETVSSFRYCFRIFRRTVEKKENYSKHRKQCGTSFQYITSGMATNVGRILSPSTEFQI